MAGAENLSNPKLPLWPTIRLSYASYARHFGDVLRITVLWLLLMAMFDAAVGWMQATWMGHVLADPSARPNLTEPVEMAVLGNITSVATAFAAVSIAVAWHRRLLLDEPPRSSGGNLLTGSLWRYIAVAIVVGVIAELPTLAVLSAVWLFGLMPEAGETIAPQTPILITAFAVASIVGVVILLRLSLLLPANATGDVDLTVKGAWRHSRGNGWRLLWGIVACALPPFLLAGLIFAGTALLPLQGGLYRAQWAIASASATCCWLIGWPIWIGFLSHAYRQLVRQSAPDPFRPPHVAASA